jgi:Flp pilus assembly protein TadB
MIGTLTSFAGGVAAVLTALAVLAAAFWWVYQQGKAAGRVEATLQALELTQVEIGELLKNIEARVARLENRQDRASRTRVRGWRKD